MVDLSSWGDDRRSLALPWRARRTCRRRRLMPWTNLLLGLPSQRRHSQRRRRKRRRRRSARRRRRRTSTRRARQRPVQDPSGASQHVAQRHLCVGHGRARARADSRRRGSCVRGEISYLRPCFHGPPHPAGRDARVGGDAPAGLLALARVCDRDGDHAVWCEYRPPGGSPLLGNELPRVHQGARA